MSHSISDARVDGYGLRLDLLACFLREAQARPTPTKMPMAAPAAPMAVTVCMFKFRDLPSSVLLASSIFGQSLDEPDGSEVGTFVGPDEVDMSEGAVLGFDLVGLPKLIVPIVSAKIA